MRFFVVSHVYDATATEGFAGFRFLNVFLPQAVNTSHPLAPIFRNDRADHIEHDGQINQNPQRNRDILLSYIT